MDREAWHAVIHGVAKSRTRLSYWTELNLTWQNKWGDLSPSRPKLKLDLEKTRQGGWRANITMMLSSLSRQLSLDFSNFLLSFWLCLGDQSTIVYYSIYICIYTCSIVSGFCHGISQARILEWASISFSRESF